MSLGEKLNPALKKKKQKNHLTKDVSSWRNFQNGYMDEMGSGELSEFFSRDPFVGVILFNICMFPRGRSVCFAWYCVSSAQTVATVWNSASGLRGMKWILISQCYPTMLCELEYRWFVSRDKVGMLMLQSRLPKLHPEFWKSTDIALTFREGEA